ncbi:MAG: NAD(P)/FAD-dependent oxidoreductase [Lutibacter sp.]|uniref:FAD-dependent oxidoreductase n=1 Tax=Lutibacter sp. TaxID=1925666 RepID=UPI0019DD448A|nr:FAD-dependent oxidoreductase [Lutibacter sp.]NOR28796.1 NAD(P)/FAD-dependent oxidoreductase [Lutibacter sp.]
MKTFDVLIIGGGAAGLSCALILGSASTKSFAKNKKVGIITHQKSSALQNALLNNVLGFEKGTQGGEILAKGLDQLTNLYPEVIQIEKEKVTNIKGVFSNFTITTNKCIYTAKNIVVAVGPSNLFNIEGLMQYVIPHKNLPPQKERIMLKNNNHLIAEGLFVAGVLAGWRSQFSIAAGSGAQVATDILTQWNNGNHTMIHDVIE